MLFVSFASVLIMFDSAACTVYIKKQIICQPLAMKYNDTLYYYVLNAQGDVVRIVDSSRSVVDRYTPYQEVTKR